MKDCTRDAAMVAVVSSVSLVCETHGCGASVISVLANVKEVSATTNPPLPAASISTSTVDTTRWPQAGHDTVAGSIATTWLAPQMRRGVRDTAELSVISNLVVAIARVTVIAQR